MSAKNAMYGGMAFLSSLMLIFLWLLVKSFVPSGESPAAGTKNAQTVKYVQEWEFADAEPGEYSWKAIRKWCESVGGAVKKRILTTSADGNPETFKDKPACVKDGKDVTDEALATVSEIVFGKIAGEDSACKAIKSEYDRYAEVAESVPAGSVRHFGAGLSQAVWFVSTETYDKYFDETDALDHVAFFEPGFVDVREGRKYSEPDTAPSGDVAVWKSEPLEVRLDGTAYDGCSVVLVIRGEKPSVSERNFTMLRIRSSSAMATVKLLKAVKELADGAENDRANAERERSERARLGIGE